MTALPLSMSTVAVPAQAASCPPASVGGPSVGTITVGGARVPIKKVHFAPGGAFDPPATNKAAGISTAHARLDADEGTSVIAWHVRYGVGCDGTLNGLLTVPIGSTFTVAAKGGAAREYRITARTTVPKGRYKAAWFDPTGPHRLSLFSCADLRGGVFHKTVAIFAEPVDPAPDGVSAA